MGLRQSEYMRMLSMMEAMLPSGVPRFDEVEEALAWILEQTSPAHFTRLSLQSDKNTMKHFVWHMKEFPGENKMCTIQGLPAWVGAGLPKQRGETNAETH